MKNRLFTGALCFLSISAAFANDLCTGFVPNYAEALQKSLFFFDAQRSGKLADNYPVNWRADSGLSHATCQYSPFTAGNTIDLSGGFYDSGDNIKFGLPTAFAITNLAWGMIEFKDGYEKSQQLNQALENLRWGTDYLLKAWDSKAQRLYIQVGKMKEDHDKYYVPYEVLDFAHEAQNSQCVAAFIDASQPGSDIAGPTAAALAAASIAFKQNGDEAYSERLLTGAKEIYNFGNQHQGLYGAAVQAQFQEKDAYENTEVKYQTLGLGVGAAWLAMAGEQSYLEDAKKYLPSDEYTLEGYTYTWQDQHYSGYLLLAYLLKDSPQGVPYKKAIDNFLNYWLSDKVPVGKDGVLKHIDKEQGSDLSETVSTSLFALTYNKMFPDSSKHADFQNFAIQQLNYILGNNPKCFSYEVGYGKDWPHYIHHGEAQGGWRNLTDIDDNNMPDRHTDYGALVGGPDQNDDFANDRKNYVQSEPMITANSLLQAVLAGLNEISPGTPLANFPEPEQKNEDEFYVTGVFDSKDSKEIEFEIDMFNHSAWPARVIYDETAYFFLNLSDKPTSVPLDKIIITAKEPKSGVVVSGLKVWNEANKIYYFTVTTNKPTYPGGESTISTFGTPSYRQIEIKIKTPWAHNFSQDFSLSSLPQGTHVSRDFKDAIHTISLYGRENPSGDMKKLWGDEPAKI